MHEECLQGPEGGREWGRETSNSVQRETSVHDARPTAAPRGEATRFTKINTTGRNERAAAGFSAHCAASVVAHGRISMQEAGARRRDHSRASDCA